MSEDCIFCNIAAGQMDSDIVYEDDRAVAFRDVNPQAPTHILVIPRDHVGNISTLDESQSDLIAHLMLTAAQTAREEGIEESGYRVVLNAGLHGGESVSHLHIHVLGGRQMSWPPG